MNDWHLIDTTPLPKDRWVWVYSRKSRSQMVTAFRWDDSNGHNGWFSGLGWWGEITQFFTHWAEITGQPPERPPS